MTKEEARRLSRRSVKLLGGPWDGERVSNYDPEKGVYRVLHRDVMYEYTPGAEGGVLYCTGHYVAPDVDTDFIRPFRQYAAALEGVR